jgi:hypothetical protein
MNNPSLLLAGSIPKLRKYFDRPGELFRYGGVRRRQVYGDLSDTLRRKYIAG